MPTKAELKAGLPRDLRRDPENPQTCIDVFRRKIIDNIFEYVPVSEKLNCDCLIEGGCGHQRFGRLLARKLVLSYKGFDIAGQELGTEMGDVLEDWNNKESFAVLAFVINWLEPEQVIQACTNCAKGKYFMIVFVDTSEESKDIRMQKISEAKDWGFKGSLSIYNDQKKSWINVSSLNIYNKEWIKSNLPKEAEILGEICEGNLVCLVGRRK